MKSSDPFVDPPTIAALALGSVYLLRRTNNSAYSTPELNKKIEYPRTCISSPHMPL